MKKFFLKDQKYTKFTKRIFTVISILAFIIIFLIIMVVSEGERHGPLMGLTYGAVTAACVWGIYGVIRWILKVFPDER